MKSSLSKKSADIIGMLVEVYGSREMFVREYSQLLAERLLKSPDFEKSGDGLKSSYRKSTKSTLAMQILTFMWNECCHDTHRVENEVRYLEMLKLRFGESEMHQCEVMLKDVTDSQRIDIFIKSFKDNALCEVSALIFSAQFWPQMKEEPLEWPAEVKNVFELFRQRFESLKASRSLDWKPNLGIVQIELTLDGKSIDFSVSPLLATIMYLFQEKDRWTVDEIAMKLKISQSVIMRRIGWWSNYGILKLLNDNSWKLADAFPSQITSVVMDEDEEMDSMPSDEDKEQQLEVYWLYITGLLKNLESLSAERIFTLLKMFGGQKKEELTLETVQNFLQKKVRDQMLVQVNEVYKLINADSTLCQRSS
uniref:Anaphase-promoting complex subunit 2 n=1 Tax=Romanomermis culicivorax TaxID=13658 RepID=A0A915JL65_ROMCU